MLSETFIAFLKQHAAITVIDAKDVVGLQWLHTHFNLFPFLLNGVIFRRRASLCFLILSTYKDKGSHQL